MTAVTLSLWELLSTGKFHDAYLCQIVHTELSINVFNLRDLQGDQLQLSQVTVEDEDEGEEEEEEDQGEEEEGEEESDGEGVGAEEQNSRVREIEDISHMSEEY